MTCPICKDTGLVAPSPFLGEGERVAWEDYRAEALAEVASGLTPPEGSAVLRGFIKPVGCPRGCLDPESRRRETAWSLSQGDRNDVQA